MKYFHGITTLIAKNCFRAILQRLKTTPLYRNSLYLMGDVFVTSLFGFLFWIIAARLYSETEVGAGSAVISAIYLLASLSIVGLDYAIIRFLPRYEKPQQLINSSISSVGVISILAAGIFVAGLPVWSPPLLFLRQNSILLSVFIFITAGMTILDLINSIFVAKRSAGLVVLTSLLLYLLRIMLLGTLALLLRGYGVIIAWGVPLIITMIISLRFFLPRIQAGFKIAVAFDLRHLKNIGNYSGGTYIASLFAQGRYLVLPLIVINMLGTVSNAYYYIAWTVASLPAAISAAVSTSLFAEGSYPDQHLKENATRSIKFAFIITVPVTIILYASARWILLAFGPGYSANALHLLWFLCFANLPRVLFVIYTGILRASSRIKELLILEGFTTLTMLAISPLAMKSLGIIGIGYSWLFIQMVAAFIITGRLLFWYKKPDNVEQID